MEAQEREQLSKIRDAIFANPFGSRRLAIDLSLTGLSASDPLPKITAKLTEDVKAIVDRIAARQHSIRKPLNDTDLQLFAYGALFYIFHLFVPCFDQHIQQQVKAGDDCCQVPFARDALGLLQSYGFSEKLCLRYFALFFQMRRAYFFINKIVGKSDCIQQLRRSLWHNIFTSEIQLYEQYLWNRMDDFSTMLLGQTGTGKGLAAAAIGRSGYIPFNSRHSKFTESFTQAFVSINLSQFPEQIIESELFGHQKGAFTGAVDQHKGVFSLCSPCGAIFLDEIGDVTLPVQVKLLRVLQERTFTPVGSHQAQKFPGRVIAATNHSLDKLRQEGKFRDDFYYRLCSDVIEVPSLRMRLDQNPNELEELLDVVLKRIFGEKPDELAAKVLQYIGKHQPPHYNWPGNIRELEQCTRQIILNNRYHWQHALPTTEVEQINHGCSQGSLSAQELLSMYCRLLYKQHGSYEAVGRISELDRRTVKKYIQLGEDQQ
ncbi:sigma 54-interacting transcriptional regulator [Desulfogranum japonicum]|uniref:sigma 54-interacting transcriptional regulator n=1 Tax=Desulfogranum japonicum TaxID=231447 RepID=UPI0004017A22|nr:sigma 54-interacting transcriptional regulator [Desulfogranum japonicum]